MAQNQQDKQDKFPALDWWRLSMIDLVRRDQADLTARQLSLLLSVYMTDGPHTVRGLAEALNISKPAVTRAVDKLASLDLVKRKRDEKDRRNVFIQRTVKGSVFLSDLSEMINTSASRTVMRKVA